VPKPARHLSSTGQPCSDITDPSVECRLDRYAGELRVTPTLHGVHLWLQRLCVLSANDHRTEVARRATNRPRWPPTRDHVIVRIRIHAPASHDTCVKHITFQQHTNVPVPNRHRNTPGSGNIIRHRLQPRPPPIPQPARQCGVRCVENGTREPVISRWHCYGLRAVRSIAPTYQLGALLGRKCAGCCQASQSAAAAAANGNSIKNYCRSLAAALPRWQLHSRSRNGASKALLSNQ